MCLQLHEWAEMKLKKMNEDDAGISADAFQVGVTRLDMCSRQYVGRCGWPHSVCHERGEGLPYSNRVIMNGSG